MNNKVVYHLYHAFARGGFSVLRVNFRGVGRSQGKFDRGEGELSDAAAALDWPPPPGLHIGQPAVDAESLAVLAEHRLRGFVHGA